MSREMVRCSGIVKWYDPFRRFGFLVTEHGDVLIHRDTLLAHDLHQVLPDTKMTVDAIKSAKGLQVYRILRLDDRNAHQPLHPGTLKMDVKPESDWTTGVVKWFNRPRGFGFVRVPGVDDDLFLHNVTVRKFGFVSIRPGDVIDVRYGYWTDANGVRAAAVAELRVHDGSVREAAE